MKLSMFAGLFLSLSLFASGLASASGGYDTPAEYEVPVPAELAKYAHFKMTGVSFETKGGRVRLSYALPLELTGVENKLRFEGTDDGSGVLTLFSERGKMECRVVSGVDTCKVQYTKIDQDMSLVERLLDAQRVPLDVKQGILAVAARIGGDMQGFIRFRR